MVLWMLDFFWSLLQLLFVTFLGYWYCYISGQISACGNVYISGTNKTNTIHSRNMAHVISE